MCLISDIMYYFLASPVSRNNDDDDMPVLWSHNDEWVEGESGVKMVEIVTCQGELGWAGESFTISSPVSIRANQDNRPEMPSVTDLHFPSLHTHPLHCNMVHF